MGDIINDINLMVCKFYTFVEMGYHGGYDSKVITDKFWEKIQEQEQELGFTASENETPGDGSCMFHALLDQIDSHPSLPPYAENHWELRYKIVCEGFEKFIDRLEWPNDPKVGSQIALKRKVMNPSTWGDEVVLQLTSNLLEVDINIITAFNDVTIIKPIDVTSSSQKQPIYLYLFSESDFESAHYQSVWPSSLPSSLPSSQDVVVTEVFSFNLDNPLMSDLEITDIRDLQVVVADQSSR